MDRKAATAKRSRAAGTARYSKAVTRGPAAAAADETGPLHEVVTAVVRRFRRGRWTLTTLPV